MGEDGPVDARRPYRRPTASRPAGRPVASRVGGAARRGARSVRDRLVPVLGGRERTRVIFVLACVLALASADTATVGAAAIKLHDALHINTTDIGLLVAVTAVVGAVFSLPFGVLADKVRRTWLLGTAVGLWGIAMIWGATANNFGDLLLSRVALGGVTAVAGPVVASLVGDWFPGGERGQIYSYILTGELLGAGIGFAFTGELAALSWRLAFVFLAIPAFLIAWAVLRLPEPRRGGRGALAPAPGTRPWLAAQKTEAAQQRGAGQPADTRPGGAAAAGPQRAAAWPPDGAAGHAGPPDGAPGQAGQAGEAEADAEAADEDQRTDAQRMALEQGIRPIPSLVARADPSMGFIQAVRYVLAVRTNVVLIVSGACGYYFLAGVETFGVEFVGSKGGYGVAPALANLLLIVIGGGSVIGTLVAGPLGDRLLKRGRLSGRVNVAAVAATVTVVVMIPALVTHSAFTALPYLIVAAMGLTAQNPPIDAARLDIMPSWLWGRAEGVRTFVRTGAQALAPLLFGAVSDYVFGGQSKGHEGLRWTFVVMLLPLAASAFYLFVAARRYPRDVATAAAAPPAPRPGPPGGRRPRPPADPSDGAARPLPRPPVPPPPDDRTEVMPRLPGGPATRRIGGWGPGARRTPS
jgi:MFS family permease